jgi:hypothetical protein
LCTVPPGRIEVSYSWRLWLHTGDELVSEAGGEPHHYGQKTDNPAVVFGWRLAEALDWTPPS